MNDNSLLKKAAYFHKSLSQKINKINSSNIHTLKFNTSKIRNISYCQNLLKDQEEYIKNEKRFIYIFKLLKSNANSNKRLIDVFNKKRIQNTSYKFSRLNENHISTNILYVGSSLSLIGRLRNHLGFGVRGLKKELGSKGTYSLHLRHWASTLNLNILLTYYVLNSFNPEELQIFEESLWLINEPLFGKRSGK